MENAILALTLQTTGCIRLQLQQYSRHDENTLSVTQPAGDERTLNIFKLGKSSASPHAFTMIMQHYCFWLAIPQTLSEARPQ